MKTNLLITKRLMVLSFSIIILQLPGAFAQGTAFTYEGRLQNNDSPASGTYNLTFSLFNTYSSGVPIAGPVTNNAVSVTNGLFTVLVDFGPGVFTGQTNWLEIAVETNGGSTFTTLSPRQQLTPVPYAIYAESANGLNGTLSADQLTSIGNTNGGGGNFFVGSSGNSTTSGSDNTANGYQALFANTSGTWNTANGEAALRMNTSGSDNAANGNQALFANTSGSYNTANGILALVNNTSGSYNIALGYRAGYNITTGSSNIDIGNPGVAGDTNIIHIGSGQSQTFIAGVINGNGSGLSSLNASQLTSIGNTNSQYGGNFFVGQSGNPTMSGSYNTANGYLALNNNTNGSGNTANGYQALNKNTNGVNNTADGNYALYHNLSGNANTANGCQALYLNTSGSINIALGDMAGFYITTGSSNIDIGNVGLSTDTNIIRIGSGQTDAYIAGVIHCNGAQLTGVINGDGSGLTNLNASAAQLTSLGNTNGGINNFFVGPSGNSTTSGSDNTANGYAALNYNTSGWDNTADGVYALYFNTGGGGNTANGASALDSNTSGNDNTASGLSALFSNTSGSDNTANGNGALEYNTSGSDNIALGYLAGYNITTGSFNIDIGNMGVPTDTNIIRIGSGQSQTFIAGVINGNGGGLTNLINVSAAQLTTIGNTNGGWDNFFVGPSGNSTTSGSENTANGVIALEYNTSGSFNTANGFQALYFNTSGNYNTANGNAALYSNRNGSYNTADGFEALFSNTSGSRNTANGNGALFSNTNGDNNTANGFEALFSNTSGWDNTANGFEALSSNTSGSYNTASGLSALFSNTSGSYNTANGGSALHLNMSGNYNTANGYSALYDNTSGSYNIALGFQAGYYITTGSSNIDIGNPGAGTDTNIIRIGTSQKATYLVGTVYANGVALTSDRNAKENFTAVNAREVLAKVASLPVTEWNYKTDTKDVQHIGPMAQDFQAAFQLGTDDKHISVVDEGGVALAAIQGLNQKLNEKDAEIQTLKQQNDSLAERLNKLQATVKQLAANK